MNKKKNSYDGSSMGRTFYFIDIENMIGSSMFTHEDVLQFRSDFEKKFHVNECDLVILGTSGKNNYLNAAMGWRGARQVFKHGHNGADEALIAAMEEQPLDNVHKVILASGDGIFADTVKAVSQSVPVEVVYRRGSLSKRLSQAVARMYEYGHLACLQ